MKVEYVHYNSCPNRDGSLCAYHQVRVICPNEGEPCRNAQHGQGHRRIHKGDQSANSRPIYHFQHPSNTRSNTSSSSGVEEVCFEL